MRHETRRGVWTKQTQMLRECIVTAPWKEGVRVCPVDRECCSECNGDPRPANICGKIFREVSEKFNRVKAEP